MKKLLTILVLIMLIISFFQITSMYALYKEQIDGNYASLLGAWVIKVNTTDITTSGQIETFDISDQLGYIESDYIQAGKIAPNGQAYFDVVIDPTIDNVATDVSIIYEFNTDNINKTNVKIDLISVENKFKKTGETDIENTQVNKNGNIYKAVMPIDKIVGGYQNYLRITFRWTNVEDYNVTDSELGMTENAILSLPWEINFKQYMGESLSGIS